jgi:hypothetical protein
LIGHLIRLKFESFSAFFILIHRAGKTRELIGSVVLI